MSKLTFDFSTVFHGLDSSHRSRKGHPSLMLDWTDFLRQQGARYEHGDLVGFGDRRVEYTAARESAISDRSFALFSAARGRGRRREFSAGAIDQRRGSACAGRFAIRRLLFAQRTNACDARRPPRRRYRVRAFSARRGGGRYSQATVPFRAASEGDDRRCQRRIDPHRNRRAEGGSGNRLASVRAPAAQRSRAASF